MLHCLEHDFEGAAAHDDFLGEAAEGAGHEGEGNGEGDDGDPVESGDDGEHRHDAEEKADGAEELHPADEVEATAEVFDLSEKEMVFVFPPSGMEVPHQG